MYYQNDNCFIINQSKINSLSDSKLSYRYYYLYVKIIFFGKIYNKLIIDISVLLIDFITINLLRITGSINKYFNLLDGE